MRRIALALALFVGLAEACSLVIPFDDYPGPAETSLDGATKTPDGQAPLPDGLAPDGTIGDPCGAHDLDADTNNCGVCTRACIASGNCTGGQCPSESVFDGSVVIRGMAFGYDDAGVPDELYFTRFNAGHATNIFTKIDLATRESAFSAALSFDLAGPVDFDPNQFASGALAGEKGALYFFKADAFNGSPGVIYKDGGTVGAMKQVGNTVFWGDGASVHAHAVRGSKDDVVANSSAAVAFAVRDTTIFWTDEFGKIQQTQIGNPAVANNVVDLHLAGVTGIAVAATTLVLTQSGQGALYFTLDDALHTPAKDFNHRPFDRAAAVVTDGAHFWIFDQNKGGATAQIERTSLDGSEWAVIASGLSSAAPEMLVTSEYLYYANGAVISRTTK